MGSSARLVAATWWMSGGLLVWGAHLGVVYAWAATVCARGWSDRRLLGLPAVELGVVVATALALLAALAILLHTRREVSEGASEADPHRFAHVVGLWVAGFSLLAIAWTAIVPTLVRPPCGSEPRLLSPHVATPGSPS